MKVIHAEVATVTKQDINALATLLKKAKDAYYNNGEFYTAVSEEVPLKLRKYLRPTSGRITDQVYDQLEDVLREWYPTHSLLKSVGIKPKGRNKIKLPFAMPSLNKMRGPAATGAWLQQVPGPYIVSDKIDGISLGYINAGGREQLVLRGDSAIGQDVTHMLEELDIPQAKNIEVRGELVMPKAAFAKWKTQFKNPRNMVAGLANRKELHEALRDCTFIAFEMVRPRMKPSAGLAKLKALGFNVVQHKSYKVLDAGMLEKLFASRRGKARYQVDGLVVTQDLPHPPSTGNPNWSVAFKSNQLDEAATVKVVNVEWNETRTGLLFPRIEIEPVDLNGVTVTYASGKSGKFIHDSGIGPGAVIEIARSGDVIPDVRSIVKKVKWQEPAVPWKWEGDHLAVVKSTSSTQSVQAITFFLEQLGVENMKAATVGKFVEAGIDSVAKLLALTEPQFLRATSASPKVLKDVYAQIQKAISGVTLPVSMYASGIFGRNFGKSRFEAIIKGIPDILREKPDAALVNKIDDLHGFDAKTATQFVKNLPAFTKWLKSVPLKVVAPQKLKIKSRKLEGEKVLMTGFRSVALEKAIIENGGSLATTVKQATILLAKDPNGSSSKLRAARQLGTSVMTEQEFRKKYKV